MSHFGIGVNIDNTKLKLLNFRWPPNENWSSYVRPYFFKKYDQALYSIPHETEKNLKRNKLETSCLPHCIFIHKKEANIYSESYDI